MRIKRILLTKPIHLACHLLPISFLSLLINACSTPAIHPNNAIVTADTIIENYQSRHDEFALSQLQNALNTYAQYDQLESVWQAEFLLANWYIANDQINLAQSHSENGYQLAQDLKQKDKQYSSSIQLGQLTDNMSLFAEAESLASDNIEKAIALTYQKKIEAAYKLFNNTQFNNEQGTASDLAFLYYQHAKAKRHLPSSLKARNYFVQAENKIGVIDSLFLAAQLSEKDQAKDYATRALRAAKAANDEFRTKAIENWSRSSL